MHKTPLVPFSIIAFICVPSHQPFLTLVNFLSRFPNSSPLQYKRKSGAGWSQGDTHFSPSPRPASSATERAATVGVEAGMAASLSSPLPLQDPFFLGLLERGGWKETLSPTRRALLSSSYLLLVFRLDLSSCEALCGRWVPQACVCILWDSVKEQAGNCLLHSSPLRANP